MSGFDRMPDPRAGATSSGRRARRALLSAQEHPEAELPLPSTSPAPPAEPAAPNGAGPGVTCTRCHRASPLGPAALLTLLRPPVVWLPWKAAPLRAVCPACRQRAWLQPRWQVAPA